MLFFPQSYDVLEGIGVKFKKLNNLQNKMFLGDHHMFKLAVMVEGESLRKVCYVGVSMQGYDNQYIFHLQFWAILRQRSSVIMSRYKGCSHFLFYRLYFVNVNKKINLWGTRDQEVYRHLGWVWSVFQYIKDTYKRDKNMFDWKDKDKNIK